jgi:hypothetical protein
MWLSNDIVRSLPNGNSAIHNYKLGKSPLKKKTITAHPIPPPRLRGWHPQYTTYTAHPINPDLDAYPTGSFEITSHPTFLDSVLLHAPDGRLISPILKARLHKLTNMFRPQNITATLPEALAGAIIRHRAATYKETIANERKLHKHQEQKQQLEYEEPWSIPDTLYDALYNCIKIKRVIHFNPVTLKLRAKEYISHDTKDAVFGALHTLKPPGPMHS